MEFHFVTEYMDDPALLISDWWIGILESLREYSQGLLRVFGSLTLVAVALALSHMNHLGLGSEMVYSIARAFLQLSLIGFVLAFVFQHGSEGDPLGLALILAVFLEMVVVAGVTVAKRSGILIE